MALPSAVNAPEVLQPGERTFDLPAVPISAEWSSTCVFWALAPVWGQSLPYKIKAIYMCADGDFSVAIRRTLPDEPKLFALVHELKHHYRDQEIIRAGIIHCGDYNQNELSEKGAEVFAAEFIYPEAEFLNDLKSLSVDVWETANVVYLKRRCKAKVSYKFICKRLERLGLISRGQFTDVKFKILEEQIYGVPFYRRKAS